MSSLIGLEVEFSLSISVINEVTHQTEDITDANTNSDFYYEAITFGGEVCDLGKLDIPEKDDRERLK